MKDNRKLFYEPVDLSGHYKMFSQMKNTNGRETFLATKEMKPGDILLLHVGQQVKKYESGIYGYCLIISNPYIYKGWEDAYCYNKLSVDTILINELKEYPIMTHNDFCKYCNQFRTRHKIEEKYYDELKRLLNINFNSEVSMSDLDDIVNEIISAPISSMPAKPIIKDGIQIMPRNENTKIVALSLAEGTCANPNCTHELFENRNGEHYLEVHHIIPLSAFKDFPDVNIDVPENVVCLCPSCHREIHYGKNAKELITFLYEERKKLLKSKNVILKGGIEQLYNYYSIK